MDTSGGFYIKHYIIMEACKYCGSMSLKEQKMHSDSLHYAKLSCEDCGKFLKWLPAPKDRVFVLWFGKYKDRNVIEMKTPDETQYLHWALQNVEKLSERQKEIISGYLKGKL